MRSQQLDNNTLSKANMNGIAFAWKSAVSFLARHHFPDNVLPHFMAIIASLSLCVSFAKSILDYRAFPFILRDFIANQTDTSCRKRHLNYAFSNFALNEISLGVSISSNFMT